MIALHPPYNCNKIASVLLAIHLLLLPFGVMAAITPLSFTVNTSEVVIVDTAGGTPSIAIDVGGVSRTATYASGSNSNALVFSYTPVVGDVDLDGIAASSPIVLNGGTIRDASGNNATLTFTPPDTANVRINYPSLSMDFVTDADGRYTLNGTAYNDLPAFLTATGGSFTRNSIGTYFDSNGILQTASANTPRFDHDPVTNAPKGILIEESRTNLLQRSSEIDHAGWAKNFAGTGVVPIVTGNFAVAPDGTLTAERVQLNKGAGVGFSRVEYNYASGSAINYACSAWIKTNDGSTKQVGIRIYSTVSTVTITNVWQRYSVVGLGNTGITGCQILLWDVASTSNSADLLIWGAQLEVGSFPTSYIPTTTAAVTRAGDVLGFTGLNYPSPIIWYGQWRLNESAKNGVQRIISANNLSGGCCRRLRAGNSGTAFQYESPVATLVANIVSVGQTPAGTGKASVRIETNNFAFYYNGALVGTDTTGTVDNVTSLFIGSNNISGGEYLNGNIQKIKIYPSSMSDTQLQLLTQ